MMNNTPTIPLSAPPYKDEPSIINDIQMEGSLMLKERDRPQATSTYKLRKITEKNF